MAIIKDHICFSLHIKNAINHKTYLSHSQTYLSCPVVNFMESKGH